MECNKKNNFLQKLYRKWRKETSSRHFFIFKKSLKWVQSKRPAAYFQYISIAFNLSWNKIKLYITLGYWSRDMLNFNLLENGAWLVSSPYLVYDFSRKIFLLLHSINWPNFIVWLPLLLEILSNMCITNVC